MARKRKRAVGTHAGRDDAGAGSPPAPKRARTRTAPAESTSDQKPPAPQTPLDSPVRHPVLSLYFPALVSLRAHFGEVLRAAGARPDARPLRELCAVDRLADRELCSLLDTALVGQRASGSQSLAEKIADATQCAAGTRTPASSQSEIVDLALQTLFRRACTCPRSAHALWPGKPNNILALGYETNRNAWRTGAGAKVGPLGVELVSKHPNTHINTVKSPPWARLASIVGEDAMLDLLLNASVFIYCGGDAVPRRDDEDDGVYYQLMGPPISDAKNDPFSANQSCGSAMSLGRTQSAGPCLGRSLSDSGPPAKSITRGRNLNSRTDADSEPCIGKWNGRGGNVEELPDLRTPGDIIFVRSRQFYSKPKCNSSGRVAFGLHHIHVLNRFPKPDDRAHTLHVLKYIFPRQFGLHNVFTSRVDRKETVQPLQDYTFREQELAQLKAKNGGKEQPVPRRLKGKVLDLVRKLQALHGRCSYNSLVRHYCPVSLCDPGITQPRTVLLEPFSSSNIDSSLLATQANELQPPGVVVFSTSPATAEAEEALSKPKERFMDYACTAGEVSAFARAVILNVMPHGLWGSGDSNRNILLRNVDRFVKLRRYESLSLHDVLQGFKLTDIEWLCPASMSREYKLSKSDEKKRRQLLAELVYWLFDSFLIPLLRSHFYITESNVHRNHVFYFRHDVWKKLSEPTLSQLKLNMLQELKQDLAKSILDSRRLGFAQVRLLPKEQGMRPIMNLRKRAMVKRGDRMLLTPSINSVMAPVFNVLSFEKSRDIARIGSTIFSVKDMYTRLKSFQNRIVERGWENKQLYFVKVDVTSCFDTIPQPKLLELVRCIMAEDEYRLEKHGEVRPPPPYRAARHKGPARPLKRWPTHAKPADELESFAEFAKRIMQDGCKGTVLVDDVVSKYCEKGELLELLQQHVQENIIKIGKKYYRQKTGIPQGSVLSSILCNFFYADLERRKLPFTIDEDGMLLRLVDDFLFITLSRHNAKRFLQVMHDGNPEYGAFINPEKTMVNFETSVNGRKINRLVGTLEFPYCGNLIHTKTLDIRKDRERTINVTDLLTVEYSRRPGTSLFRKIVSYFKIHAHAMFFDVKFNRLETIMQNIYHNFVEVAMKFHRYVKSLSRSRPTDQRKLISTLSSLLDLAFVMVKRRQQSSEGRFECTVTYAHVKWLGAHAFNKVLSRKQSGYRDLLGWLRKVEARERQRLKGQADMGVADFDLDAFEGYRY